MNVIMISPGYPAEMAFFARGLAAAGATVIGVGDQPPPSVPHVAREALAYYQQVGSLAALAPEVGSLVVESRLPEPGQMSSGSYEGDGYVIVRHPDTTVVTDAMWRLITGVRVELG